MAISSDQLIKASDINSVNSGKYWEWGIYYNTNTQEYYYPSSSGFYCHTRTAYNMVEVNLWGWFFYGFKAYLQKKNDSGSWQTIQTINEGTSTVGGDVWYMKSNGEGWYRLLLNYTRCNGNYIRIYWAQRDCKEDEKLAIWKDCKTSEEPDDLPFTADNLNSGKAGTFIP